MRCAAREGYAGVEFPLAQLAFEAEDEATAIARVRDAKAETGLKVSTLIATRPTDYGSAAEHLADFRRQSRIAAELRASLMVVHAGADSFDDNTALGYLRDAARVAEDHGLFACMETHRGRLLNDPWRTARLLDALPDMQLALDVSHWHVIVDREPLDLMDLFDEAARRSGHVHARIGHEKGPQVPHPADPIWEGHLALYRRWWTIARDAMQARGQAFGVTAEFGPPPYMTTRPFSGERDADLVELNRWMRDRLEEWFG
ncbi:sugar phosphate isomerase/epimerase family protein [Oceaniglobus trochenteri]|uniref:sugar phosphate isomerase/epimerase family protein n=1 Tax=Oceaniglobus trochenteri TaxID=2763260 RepID=UPI001CFFD2A5|nr:TIM barrel protein [Oceaniglobus trochenteri]